eukprot:4937388-Pyramimonas_sp.AAC.1
MECDFLAWPGTSFPQPFCAGPLKGSFIILHFLRAEYIVAQAAERSATQLPRPSPRHLALARCIRIRPTSSLTSAVRRRLLARP